MMVDFETFMTTQEDHLIPRKADGEDSPVNIVTSCHVCNKLKGSWDPSEEIPAGLNDKDSLVALIDAARRYIMDRRATNMAIFAGWTHPKDYARWPKNKNGKPVSVERPGGA